MELGEQASVIGVLADETRRALYEFVCQQREPVGREQSAEALGIAMHRVSFHLDRLVDEGLLEVEYRRLSGKTGPGAGRPSKLYRRAPQEIAVSLPPRRYDLVGDILAAAISNASAGTALDDALADAAKAGGAAVGAAAIELARADKHPDLADVLRGQGYEPVAEEEVIELANCPFDALAQKHTELVCGLNRSYVQGVVDSLGYEGVEACLEPEPGWCCVKARGRRVRPAATG